MKIMSTKIENWQQKFTFTSKSIELFRFTGFFLLLIVFIFELLKVISTYALALFSILSPSKKIPRITRYVVTDCATSRHVATISPSWTRWRGRAPCPRHSPPPRRRCCRGCCWCCCCWCCCRWWSCRPRCGASRRSAGRDCTRDHLDTKMIFGIAAGDSLWQWYSLFLYSCKSVLHYASWGLNYCSDFK